jgi:hypothetical protein
MDPDFHQDDAAGRGGLRAPIVMLNSIEHP